MMAKNYECSPFSLFYTLFPEEKEWERWMSLSTLEKRREEEGYKNEKLDFIRNKVAASFFSQGGNFNVILYPPNPPSHHSLPTKVAGV